MFPIRDHNPSERVPVVTYLLIAANIVVFLTYLPHLGDERTLFGLYWQWGLVPAMVTHGEGYLGFFTSMFVHAGFMHIAGNMLFLWIFGDNLEDRLGHVGFAVFYLASGLGAALLQVAPAPDAQVPMVGASGAIAGVMGGYLLLFPRARVDVLVIFIIFFRIFPLPAWVMLGLWFGLQVFNGVANGAGDSGVAYWAHAGGFLVGMAAVLPSWLAAGGLGFWRRTQGHPDHPEARYRMVKSPVPRVTRRR
ncbi:rhomboid family intramembrane serine protease [Sinisalibacter aestuarii]|uniref:Rhomboid family intramembrane serine protease n=1 Tax=Sinisalibacter aestuarii TaxID=2949426 RepID=A0ABQ5LQA5_9RHOB|nr:rhomboid family intramembrane serine protease [Sinisalibacter aestuarii]GKY87166.1 rhomboid family intramembrane serine protease [Sinisalibacter aestuarii]